MGGGRTDSHANSVREYGLGGTGTPLPGYTFIYDDDMHLTSATNGYGGTVAIIPTITGTKTCPTRIGAGTDNIVSESRFPVGATRSCTSSTIGRRAGLAAGPYTNHGDLQSGRDRLDHRGGWCDANPNAGDAALPAGALVPCAGEREKDRRHRHEMRLGLRYNSGQRVHVCEPGSMAPPDNRLPNHLQWVDLFAGERHGDGTADRLHPPTRTAP